VGKRTAERLIVELREKVAVDDKPGDSIAVAPGAVAGTRDPRGLARDGLLELGYTSAEADALLREASGESTEELIAGALRAARTG
jgi:Holliday junction DNA helicase RuvA